MFHIHHLISSSQQPCDADRVGSNVSICVHVETEVQRGSMTCLRPHSKSAAELGPEVSLNPLLQPLALSTDYAVLQEDPPLLRVSATAKPGPPTPSNSAAWKLGRQLPPSRDSLAPSTCSLKIASPELGPHPPPTCSLGRAWPRSFLKNIQQT